MVYCSGLENLAGKVPETAETAELCGFGDAQDALFTERSDGRDGAKVGTPPCAGKRHYPSRPRAERGLKALLREKHGGRRSPGHFHTYQCECGRWCVGTGHADGRPPHKRKQPMNREAFGGGATIFAKAEAIARERYPTGANASQLGAILREVLSGGGLHG